MNTTSTYIYHEDVTVTQRDEHCSRKRCYRALEELNKLIPGFEEKANAAEDVNIYCIPVCHSHNLITANLILNWYHHQVAIQEQTTHAAMTRAD